MSYRDDAAAAEALAEASEIEVARLEARRLALGLTALREEVEEKQAEVTALLHDIQSLHDARVPAKRVRTALLFTCAVLASCLGPLFASWRCP